jgi:PII-like signaling protein
VAATRARQRASARLIACDLLHRRGVAGATVLLGVDGTTNGQRARALFFSSHARVPLMVIAVGPGEPLARVVNELRGLLHDPLITLERIHVCKRDGSTLTPPAPPPRTDEHGLALWQKVTVYTSAAAQHDNRPANEELVRRLCQIGASGATTLRGIWGFHGDHGPHGDRLIQVRRRVPAVTIVIDTPERIAQSLAIIDDLTSERGPVISEPVPTAQARTQDNTRGRVGLARHHTSPWRHP